MRSHRLDVSILIGALALGALVVGCDASEDAAVGVTQAPWSMAVYDPPTCDEKNEGCISWSVEFESTDDVAKFASDFDCKSEKSAEVCEAVTPANEVLKFADTSSPDSVRVCRRGNHRPPGAPRCVYCCTWSSGAWPPVTCHDSCTGVVN